MEDNSYQENDKKEIFIQDYEEKCKVVQIDVAD